MGNETEEQKEIRIRKLLKIVEISQDGYAGMLPNGNIVDRREFPNAIPVQKNSLFGIPTPKKLNIETNGK